MCAKEEREREREYQTDTQTINTLSTSFGDLGVLRSKVILGDTRLSRDNHAAKLAESAYPILCPERED